jgi:hypothetical protein
MKVKILIVLPLILTVGILLGHLMQVLANPGIVTNPGHSAASIGGTLVGERTFGSNDVYIFQNNLQINGNRIRFTGTDGSTSSWISRSLDDSQLLIGWDANRNTVIPNNLNVGGNLGLKVQIITCSNGAACDIWSDTVNVGTNCPSGYSLTGCAPYCRDTDGLDKCGVYDLTGGNYCAASCSDSIGLPCDALEIRLTCMRITDIGD